MVSTCFEFVRQYAGSSGELPAVLHGSNRAEPVV